TVAVGAYSAYQTKKAGLIQQAELKAQAKTEAVAAGQQQIERRRSLIRALSSQNAAAGAAGIETSGSAEAIARRDIRDAQNDLSYGTLNSQNRQRALRSQASNAARIGNTSAATSLLDTANTTYRNFADGN
ncbi:MAG: hypothetical protein ACREXP_00105, partial [Steroidobacteraceae bacterium]